MAVMTRRRRTTDEDIEDPNKRRCRCSGKATTPVGVVDRVAGYPKVASRRTGQPWALRQNPFGIPGLCAGRALTIQETL
jgi:hypothetical protein